MFPILRALVSLFSVKRIGAYFALVIFPLFSFGSEIKAIDTGFSSVALESVSSIEQLLVSSSSVVENSLTIADSLLASFSPTLESSSSGSSPDAIVSKLDTSANHLKPVLYLSGGENAPWFMLGVLYAIEEYHIPIDSIVGTSWGAWIGAMWAKGMRLDDIQRLLLEKDFEPFVGHNHISSKIKLESPLWPISENGIPSLRYRFAVQQDSQGIPHRVSKLLSPDTMSTEFALARLRFQESLNRQSVKWKIPFGVLGCDGQIGSTNEDIIQSLPLPKHEKSGEVCPYYAVPIEDSPNEYPIIAVANPIRSKIYGDPWQRTLKKYAEDRLKNQPGLIIRAHSFIDTSHNALIQAGFSAMESRMNNLSFLQNRKKDYESTKCNVYPWFRYNPTFDSLSAEKHASAKSYWNESDTGIVAPRNFAFAMIQNPVYDSLSFDMLANGDLVVGAKSSPIFDVAVGGFGSNVIGPNAYGELGVRFVNQMEIDLKLSGFYGGSSYGLHPQLGVHKLWTKNWNMLFSYEWSNRMVLSSYLEDIPDEDRIYNEKRSDLSVAVEYDFYNQQKVALDFLFGKREFELDELTYEDRFFNTYPVSPSLRYEFSSGNKDKWFATEGYDVVANLGLQSIGFDLSKVDFIPIYWKATFDARYTKSPKDFATFTIGTSGGVERYHEEGYGYVYPKDFEYAVLSNCFRMHPEATPWGNEWYESTLASHHYALVRASGALHYKGNGFWIFGAFVHDFESNPSVELGDNKMVLEPALRFNYKSINIYAGMSRTVDFETISSFKEFEDYKYFIRIGNYNLF